MQQQSIEQVAIDCVSTPPQIREKFDEESLVGMAQSIKEVGVQQPILLRRCAGKLVLTDGARRLLAAKKAGLSTIPAIIEDRKLSDSEVLQQQYIANCQRDDLLPMEKAKAIQALMKSTGWTPTQAASKLGQSNSAISRLLALLTLPEAIRKRVETGEISASAAYELARVTNVDEQAKLAGQVMNGELTRDALSSAVKARKTPNANLSSSLPSRVTAKLNEGRSVTVCAPSLDLDAFIETLETLLAKARQARPKNLALGTFLKVLRDQSQQ